jgi:hypothetical protein
MLKTLTSEELKIKDTILEKVTKLINKQMEEMRTMKTVISLPVLRNQFNSYECRNVTYDEILEQCYQIIRYAYRGQIIDKPILPPVANSSARNSNSSIVREI